MNRNSRNLPLLIALGLGVSLPALAADNPAQPPAKDAMVQTKITEADARKTAQSAVPNASVTSSKLVADKGRQVWTFDLKSASSKNDFVIQVDANTGRIVGKSIKNAAQAGSAKRS